MTDTWSVSMVRAAMPSPAGLLVTLRPAYRFLKRSSNSLDSTLVST
ncbi:MAG: hypothetical protein ACXWDI_16165 [Nocardioides sp.]